MTFWRQKHRYRIQSATVTTGAVQNPKEKASSSKELCSKRLFSQEAGILGEHALCPSGNNPGEGTPMVRRGEKRQTEEQLRQYRAGAQATRAAWIGPPSDSRDSEAQEKKCVLNLAGRTFPWKVT